MTMKLLLALLGSVLLCASAVSGAGLIVPANPSAWFPSVGALGLGLESMSEPAWLFVLGVGFVLLAQPIRRKKR
jgi:hypothetical protein